MIIFAERGDIEQSEPLPIPTQNFPGYFDTNIVPKNKFTFNLPLGTLNFGVTENFSLGINLPVTVVFNLPLVWDMRKSWWPVFAANARYRFFSNKKLASTLTIYGGYLDYNGADDKIKLYFINGTYNNSITINNQQFITTQISALQINYQNHDSDSTKFDAKTLNTITLALGHNYIFDQTLSLQNLFAIPILWNLHSESAQSKGNITFKHIQNFPFFYRAMVSWKVTPSSLITFGGLLLTQTDIHLSIFPWDIPLIVLPWFDWTILF